MANNDDSVIISVSADMSNFNKGVREAIQGTEKIIDKGKELEEKMSGTGASLNSVGASAENLADKMAEAADAIEGTAQSIESVSETAADVSDSLQGLSASIEETANSNESLQDSSGSVSSALGEQEYAASDMKALFAGLKDTLLEVISVMREMTDVLKENKTQTEANSKATDELNETAKKSLQFQKLTSVYPMVAKAAAKLVKTCGELVKIYSVQEQAETRLTAINKSMGASAGYTTEELKKMASAMQANSTFGDEIVMGAEKTLLALGTLNKEGFEKALQASADLAAAMGTDIDSAAQSLSRALLDPENGLRSLRQAGVAFTEAEKEQIKTLMEAGETNKAQALVLDKVESKYKGMAKAIADTDTGKIKQISNTWGDIKEKMGANILDTLSPVLDVVQKRLGKVNDEMERTKRIEENFQTVAGGGEGSKKVPLKELQEAKEEAKKRAERFKGSFAGMAGTAGLGGVIPVPYMDYDKIITELDKEIERKQKSLELEKEIQAQEEKRKDFYSNKFSSLETADETNKRNVEIGKTSANVASFLDSYGIKDEEKALEGVKKRAMELQEELRKLGTAFYVGAEEPTDQFKELQKTIDDCDKQLEEIKNNKDPFKQITDSYGSLSKTFQVSELDEQIKSVEKAMEDLGDKDKAVCEEIIKSLEEQKTALLETKDPVQDLINEFGSLSESFKADKLAEQLKRVEGALDSLKDKTDDDSRKLKNYLEEARDAMKGGGEETLNFLNKKIKDTEITWGSAFSSIGSQFGDMLGAMTEMQNQYLQNEIDNMQAELDARLEADDITQEEEKEMMNQISDLKARQFEAEKKNSIAQALINGALAITSVWSTQGAVPWLAAAISGLVTATTAMQVATISSQSYQKFERGGIVGGSGITGDKHPILANAGELILTRAQQNSIASQLMQDKAPMVISVDFSGQVFGDERTISEYVYNGIKNAQREGILREW